MSESFIKVNQLREMMKERFEALRSGDKYRYRAFLARYHGGKRNLPTLDEIERAMHMVRAQEMALPERERSRSHNWLALYDKYFDPT
jgi:hypothetical protein